MKNTDTNSSTPPEKKAPTESSKLLSTTSLAKKLDLPTKQLFTLLNDSGWITRTNDQWQLTNKGEFEGGEYKTHSKFGQYIVWPAKVENHRLFKQVIEHNEGSTHSATAIAKSLTSALEAQTKVAKDSQAEKQTPTEKQSISAKRLNAIFFELGFINKSKGGWQPTDLGKALGGQININDKTGVPFVLWPKSIQHNPYLQHSINSCFVATEKTESQKAKQTKSQTDRQHTSLDGHTHQSTALQQIDNWLYHAGHAHAINRILPAQVLPNSDAIEGRVEGKAEGKSEALTADFYLPSEHIYIEYWGYEQTPAYLKQKLAKQKHYETHGLKLIELTANDLLMLDEVLAKGLLGFGL